MNGNLYKILFVKGFPKTYFGRFLVMLYSLFKLLRKIIRLNYIILPLGFRTKCLLPLDRKREDFDETLIYVYYGRMYELLSEFRCENKCGVILDVGAHYGFYTLKMAKRAKLVISLEPNPKNYMILKHNVRINKLSNVATLPIAAGSELHQAYIIPGETDGESHIADQISNNTRAAKVPVYRLDEILLIYGIDCVDIAKIDVEGYELEVLKGLRSYLKRGLIKHIVLEVHNKSLLKYAINMLRSEFRYNTIVYRLASGLYILYAMNNKVKCNPYR